MSVPAPPTITVPETNRPGLPSPDITIDLSPAARIRAHKLVLAAASPVFHKLLLRDPSATVLRCGSDLASIRSYSSWVLFLRCLYPASRVGDHVSVSKHAALIAGLVHLAYKYKVRRMLIGLESLIICKAHKTPSVMRFACQYKLTRLIRSCVDELVPLRATTRMRNSVQTRQIYMALSSTTPHLDKTALQLLTRRLLLILSSSALVAPRVFERAAEAYRFAMHRASSRQQSPPSAQTTSSCDGAPDRKPTTGLRSG